MEKIELVELFVSSKVMGFYLLCKHKWPNGGELVRWKGTESRVHRSFNTHKKYVVT